MEPIQDDQETFQKCAEPGCKVGLVHPEQYGDKCVEHLLAERDRLIQALSDLTQWVIGSDCYKHLPDSVVKAAREALTKTTEEQV